MTVAKDFQSLTRYVLQSRILDIAKIPELQNGSIRL